MAGGAGLAAGLVMVAEGASPAAAATAAATAVFATGGSAPTALSQARAVAVMAATAQGESRGAATAAAAAIGAAAVKAGSMETPFEKLQRVLGGEADFVEAQLRARGLAQATFATLTVPLHRMGQNIRGSLKIGGYTARSFGERAIQILADTLTAASAAVVSVVVTSTTDPPGQCKPTIKAGVVVNFDVVVSSCPPFEIKSKSYRVRGSGLAHGDVRTVTCDKPEDWIGGNATDVVQCLFGSWEQRTVQCRSSCSDFTLGPAYVIAEPADASVDHGANRTVTCAPGAKEMTDFGTRPIRQQTVECDNGVWRGLTLKCNMGNQFYWTSDF